MRHKLLRMPIFLLLSSTMELTNMFLRFISLPENSPDNSDSIGPAVGGVVGAFLAVVSVTAVVVLTVYCYMCARRKGSVDL